MSQNKDVPLRVGFNVTTYFYAYRYTYRTSEMIEG